ncbi:MAG TPA: PepSY domain-containing protein [Taishania sp.]|nr:PepSY domain-containing protein [Taishania sp.]
MVRSFWRWSHLILAIVASVVLLAASISGAFLAVEPVQNNNRTTFDNSWNNTTIQHTIEKLKSHYSEITSIEKDKNGFFVADVFTADGEQKIVQFNPTTGKTSGKISEQSAFYSWMTTFHRSLFLDTTGRFLEGITAVLLFFITISGTILVFQRTKSFKAFYDKVEKNLNVQFYHIVFGRLAFIPIIVIALTGGYLFLKRFEVVKTIEPQRLEVDFEHPKEKLGTYSFAHHKIGDIQRIEFPLFEDPMEYYTIFTKEKTLAVDQFTYKILDQENIPTATQLATLSLDWHTGRKNSVWSIILGLCSISILYFIYSGFKITLLKMKGNFKNKYALGESEILLLYGSETGNTRNFAKLIYEQLLHEGKKVHLAAMNNYQPATQIQHLIILTSTYGTGDAPAGATKFLQKWKEQPLQQAFSYSIVGFGSLAYPDFCNYALQVEKELAQYPQAKAILPLVKIHNQSYHSLKTWALDWQKASSIALTLPVNYAVKQLPTHAFTVVKKEHVTVDGNTTFNLLLKTQKKIKFHSGDLLAVYPPNDPFKRNYSIGKLNDSELIISVRLDSKGVCSNYLYSLQENDVLNAAVESNPSFHFNTSKPAIFIGNGTGMGPFLGMLHENTKHQKVALYWGGRTQQSYALYEKYVQAANVENVTTNIALSREQNPKVYVGDLIKRDGKILVEQLKNGSIIYICGTLAMQQSVLEELDGAARQFAQQPLNKFQKNGQLKMDCY